MTTEEQAGQPGDILELPAASRATDIALDELELVYAFIYARVGNRADAEDLTQQVAMKAIPRLHQTAPASAKASVAVLAPPLAIHVTPPPTDTLTPETGTSNPGFALMLILLGVAGFTLGIGFVTPAPERVRRRNRLG